MEINPRNSGEEREDPDCPRALAILGSTLGAGYVDGAQLQALIQGRDSKLCLVALDKDKEIVAVATGAVTPLDELLATLPSDMQDLVGQYLADLRDLQIGRLQAVAVAAGEQHVGIGTAMVIRAVGRLVAMHADSVITFAWIHPDGTCPIQSVVESLGFHEVAEVSHFWQQDSKTRDYRCPKCGQPASCGVKIFMVARDALLPRLKSHEHKWYSGRNILDLLFHFDSPAK